MIEPGDALQLGWGDRDAAIEVFGAAAVLEEAVELEGQRAEPQGRPAWADGGFDLAPYSRDRRRATAGRRPQ